MKKSLFLFTFLLATLMVNAQGVFTAPEEGKYPDGYVINTLLKVNGYPYESVKGVEIAAFVDGECRDVVSSAQNTERFNETNYIYSLRVMGDETDNGKSVTFKVVLDGIVYDFTTTVPYVDQGTYEPIPLVLNLDRITGVELPESIQIKQKLGTTYDLSQHLTFLYEGVEGYKPLGESSINLELSPISFDWDFGNSSDFFSVNGNTLTTIAECENSYLGYAINMNDEWGKWALYTAYTMVTITVPSVPVTSITTKSDSYTCWNGDNIADLLIGEITVLPADASNKDVKFIQKQGPTGGLNSSNVFEKPGNYVITIQSVSNESVTKDIAVTVLQHVQSITSDVTSVTVNVGENVFDAINASITVLPDNATNKKVIFSVYDTQYISTSGEALKKTPDTNGITVTVASVDNARASLQMNVIILDPVKAISINPTEITVMEGTDVDAYIHDNVTVTLTPSTVDQTAWRALPSTADATYFPDNIATTPSKTGEYYTWNIVSTENTNIQASLKVYVTEAVELSCDGYAELTIVTPGTIQLTVEKGQQYFNPALVTAVVDGDVAQVAGISADGLLVTVNGKKVTNSYFEIYYDGKYACGGKLMIGGEVTLENGWNWVSNYTDYDIPLTDELTGEYLNQYFSGTNKIVEMRSQDELLFNDPTYGVFGQINTFKAATMYKVNSTGTLGIKSFANTTSTDLNVTLKGYTWISYPVIGDHTMAYFDRNNLLSDTEEGDIIIGKDGFAEYGPQGWIATDGFRMQTGKGYIFYQENATNKTLNFGENYIEEPVSPSAKSRTPRHNVWQFNANSYPETMCVVTRIDGIQASDRYSVGAFIDGECRGKGTFVDNDVMFITVAGCTGDNVSFRLYDAETDEYMEMTEVMTFTMKKGSLRTPVTLSVSETTDISSINSQSAESSAAYNLVGQRVNSSTKGIIIKNGKKYLNK